MTKNDESHRRHAEARAKAIMHAAMTGEVVVGNLEPDGEWSLTAIAQRVTSQEPTLQEPPPAPRIRWHARIWTRITHWFGS